MPPSNWFKSGDWWCRRVMTVKLYASRREWQTEQRGIVMNRGLARSLKDAKARAVRCAYEEAAAVLAVLKESGDAP